MGAKESTTQSKEFVQHERLGPIRIFEVQEKNQDGQTQQIPKMQVNCNVESNDAHNRWVQQLRKINDAQGQQLFLVPESHVFTKAGMCGSSGITKLIFNKYEFVLSSQIKNRNNLNKYFDESEIWYVLYNLVRAGNKFEILKQKIGDIHPNNILINQDGQTAIISTISLPGQIDNFQRYSEDIKAEVFLAPEQMQPDDIQKKLYNQKIDKSLAEVWSLGMTLLSAGTLQHCNDVYQRNPLKINHQRLNFLLQLFANRYSAYLTSTLKQMLEASPERRIRSKNLYQTLSQYETQILDLQPFGPFASNSKSVSGPQGFQSPYNVNGQNNYQQTQQTQQAQHQPVYQQNYQPQINHNSYNPPNQYGQRAPQGGQNINFTHNY